MLSPSCPVPLMVSPGIQIRTSLRIFRVFLESITSSTGITQRFSLPSLLYPTYLDQEVSGVLLVPNTPQTTFSCKIYSFETHSCHSYHPYWRHLLSVPPHSLTMVYLKDAFCQSSHALLSSPSSLLVSDPWLTEF